MQVEYSCDQLIDIEKTKDLIVQLPFLENIWNLIEQLQTGKEPLVIPAINLEKAHNANKICDVQVNKVEYAGGFKYHIFMIDAFPFNANFGAIGTPDSATLQGNENDRHAMISAETDYLQHYQLNFNEQISNDFDWPLYQILLSTDALQRQLSNSKSLAFVHLIQQAAVYLDHLSKRNLDFSNYISSNKGMVVKKIDLFELMDSIFQLFKRDPGSYFKGVKINILPDVPRYFSADVVRISQIISNLLSAVIKYGSKGEINVKVSFNTNIKNPVYSFTVQHSGIYIERDSLPHIFSANLKTGEETNERTHIPGLYLVKKLVDMMQGEAQIKSNDKEGTTISIDLPVSDVEYKARNTEVTEDKIPFPKLPELRILIVEDSSIDRMVLSNALDEYGFMYETAVNGIDALKMLNAQDFDIILMDLYMPHLDGFQTIGKIRNNINDKVRVMPVLALSSSGGQSNLQEVVKLGANDYLLKPFNKQNLLKKILTLTGNLNMTYLNTYLKEDAIERCEVDIQAFRESSMGDLQFMMGLMENVIDQTEESLILLNRFLLDDNFDAIKKVVHKIKPIVKLYGIPQLDKALAEAEQLSIRRVDFREWQVIIDELQTLFNQAVRSLNNEILNIRKGVFYTDRHNSSYQNILSSH